MTKYSERNRSRLGHHQKTEPMTRRLALVAAALMVSQFACLPSFAQKLYKVIDSQGNISYQDFPPQQTDAQFEETTIDTGVSPQNAEDDEGGTTPTDDGARQNPVDDDDAPESGELTSERSDDDDEIPDRERIDDELFRENTNATLEPEPEFEFEPSPEQVIE